MWGGEQKSLFSTSDHVGQEPYSRSEGQDKHPVSEPRESPPGAGPGPGPLMAPPRPCPGGRRGPSPEMAARGGGERRPRGVNKGRRAGLRRSGKLGAGGGGGGGGSG